MKAVRVRGVHVALLLVLAGCRGEPAPIDPPASSSRCGPDAVAVGPACVDKFEGSVWQIPPNNPALVQQVRDGTATLAALRDGGAQQAGCKFEPFDLLEMPATFDGNGNWQEPLYAASVAGVFPTTCITWFQAEQACRLANKRLVTNQEWQAAASGTPDPEADDGSTTCTIGGELPVRTGSRTQCVSRWGTADMIGNVWEWTGDWTEMASACDEWPERYGKDGTCVGGDGNTNYPAAVARGGSWSGKTGAGVFSISNNSEPSAAYSNLGFRCAR